MARDDEEASAIEVLPEATPVDKEIEDDAMVSDEDDVSEHGNGQRMDDSNVLQDSILEVIDDDNGNDNDLRKSSGSVQQEIPSEVLDDDNDKDNEHRKNSGSVQAMLTVNTINVKDVDISDGSALQEAPEVNSNDQEDGVETEEGKKTDVGSDSQAELPVVSSSGSIIDGHGEFNRTANKDDHLKGMDNGSVLTGATSLVNNNNNDHDIEKGSKKCDGQSDDVECCWSWVVLASSIVSCIIAAGQVQSVNIYFVVFLEEFKKSRSFTAWISAAQSTALCVTGPLSSLLLPKMGARLTIITGSIAMATCLLLVSFATSVPYLIAIYACIGASQCFLTGGNLSTLSLYFRRRASFATGIMLAGAGIGSMVTGLELEWSIETFGWRGAMLIQAGIVLNICVCGSLVFNRKSDSKKEEKPGNGVSIVGQDQVDAPESKKKQQEVRQENNQTSLRNLSLDPLFWLSVVSFVGLQANFATMLTVFKGYVISVGLEDSFKTVLTTVGMGSMVGRLLSGPVGQLLCPPLHMTAVATICALANALYILVDRPWTLAVVGAVFGFGQGQMVVAYIICLSWVFGQKEMPVVRGHVIFFGVLPGLLCPPIAGYTVDLTGNYNIALAMSAAATLSCSLAGLVTYFVHRGRARRRSERSFSLPALGDVTSDDRRESYAPYVSV